MVGAAAAEVTIHGGFNFLQGGVWIFFEEGRGRHDLTGLAISALRNVHFIPSQLQWVISIFGESFDGGDFGRADGRDGHEARADGGAIEVDCASAALADAATEFCSNELQVVAQEPEQWCVCGNIHLADFTVDIEGVDRHFCFQITSNVANGKMKVFGGGFEGEGGTYYE